MNRCSLVGTGLAIVVLMQSPHSHAALGGNLASVKGDQAIMSASRSATQGSQYTVHTKTLPRGTVVREYVSSSGTVFAVTWRGPAMPNLTQLLGTYTTQATEGMKAFRQTHGGNGPGLVSASNFVMQSGGHMGGYIGRAWLPTAVPTGTSIKDLK